MILAIVTKVKQHVPLLPFDDNIPKKNCTYLTFTIFLTVNIQCASFGRKKK